MHRFIGCLLIIALLVTIPSWVDASQEKSPPEKLVSFSFVKADLTYVLKVIAKELGMNIVVDPLVKGSVTMDLKKVPALGALNLVVKMNGYEYKALDGTIVVGTEKTLEKIPSNLMSMGSKQITRVFRLQYADPGEIASILKPLYPDAKIQEDTRLHALVIIADADTLSRIAELIYGAPAK